jgi:hypothetical protein
MAIGDKTVVTDERVRTLVHLNETSSLLIIFLRTSTIEKKGAFPSLFLNGHRSKWGDFRILRSARLYFTPTIGVEKGNRFVFQSLL